MLNIAKSNLRYPSQIAFLGLHGVGTIFGLAYNSRTPDLYPKASHNGLGRALSVLVIAHFIIGVVKDFIGRTSDLGTKDERAPFIAEATGRMTMEEEHNTHASNQPSTSSSSRAASPYPELSESSIENDSETLFDVHLHYKSRLKHGYDEPMTWSRRWANVSGSNLLVRILDLWFGIVDRGLLILGFVAICTGIVTMAGIFVRILIGILEQLTNTYEIARETDFQWIGTFHQRRSFRWVWSHHTWSLDRLFR
jgi:hypothetical protein